MGRKYLDDGHKEVVIRNQEKLNPLSTDFLNPKMEHPFFVPVAVGNPYYYSQFETVKNEAEVHSSYVSFASVRSLEEVLDEDAKSDTFGKVSTVFWLVMNF